MLLMFLLSNFFWNVFLIKQFSPRQFSQAMIKTIKFRENPRPDELVKQLDLVFDKFEQIYMSIRNLTIRLEK